jgi:hypothetical protein
LEQRIFIRSVMKFSRKQTIRLSFRILLIRYLNLETIFPAIQRSMPALVRSYLNSGHLCVRLRVPKSAPG